jgi:hypothetical protein
MTQDVCAVTSIAEVRNGAFERVLKFGADS